jgi:rod shape-determining protein MreD
MRFIVLVVATYAAAVAQTVLAPALEVRHVMPDLLALVAVLWQLSAARSRDDRAAGGTPRGFIAAALVGLAYDFTSSGPLGVGLGLFAAVGFFTAWVHAKVDLAHPLVQLATMFFATAAIAAGEAVLWRLHGEMALTWSTLAVRAACVGVYTAGLAAPTVMVLGWFREVRPLETRLQ